MNGSGKPNTDNIVSQDIKPKAALCPPCASQCVSPYGRSSPLAPAVSLLAQHIPPIPHAHGVHSLQAAAVLGTRTLHHLKITWRFMNNQWKCVSSSQNNTQHNLAKCHYRLIWFNHEVSLLSKLQMIFTRSKASSHTQVFTIFICKIKTSS